MAKGISTAGESILNQTIELAETLRDERDKWKTRAEAAEAAHDTEISAPMPCGHPARYTIPEVGCLACENRKLRDVIQVGEKIGYSSAFHGSMQLAERLQTQLTNIEAARDRALAENTEMFILLRKCILAIDKAIYDEDGLDGREGEPVLNEIRLTLHNSPMVALAADVLDKGRIAAIARREFMDYAEKRQMKEGRDTGMSWGGERDYAYACQQATDNCLDAVDALEKAKSVQ